MADAVVLLAVVFLAIAPLSDSILETLHLFFPRLDGSLSFVVLTALTSAHTGVTGDASFATDTVKLATFASLTVASLICLILWINDTRLSLSWWTFSLK